MIDVKAKELWLEKALSPILVADEFISVRGVYAKAAFSELTRMTTKELAVLIMIIHLRRRFRDISDDGFKQELISLLPDDTTTNLHNLPFLLWAIGWAAMSVSHKRSFDEVKKIIQDDVIALVIVALCARRHVGFRHEENLRKYLLNNIPENSIIYFCLSTTGADHLKKFTEDFLSRYRAIPTK